MTSLRRRVEVLTCLTIISAATLSGCGFERNTGPYDSRGANQGSSGGGGPLFLQPSPGAPTIANPNMSYWVKKGTDTVVRMYYHALPGLTDSTTFLALHYLPNSLATRPDGSAIAVGDSVLITTTLSDPTNLVVDCQPAGLRFSSSDPVTMVMSFAYTNVRASAVPGLKIWVRETAADPWRPLVSVVTSATYDVASAIGGFSGYALAY